MPIVGEENAQNSLQRSQSAESTRARSWHEVNFVGNLVLFGQTHGRHELKCD